MKMNVELDGSLGDTDKECEKIGIDCKLWWLKDQMTAQLRSEGLLLENETLGVISENLK